MRFIFIVFVSYIFLILSVKADTTADNFSCNFTFNFDSTLDNLGKVKVTKNNKDNYNYKLQIRRVDEKLFKVIYDNNASDNGVDITNITSLSVMGTNRSFLFDTTFISIFSENLLEPEKAPNPNTHSAILSQHKWGTGGPRAFQEFGICISE